MSTLLSPSRTFSSLLDDDGMGFPMPFSDNDFWTMPSRMLNTPFFRNGGVPAVNVKESAKAYELEVAAPGYRKEDLKVNVENGVLTIGSERKKETEEEKNGYTRREFSYRSFQRAFRLPAGTDGDKVTANYVDGILRLSIPKVKAVPEKNGKEVRIG